MARLLLRRDARLVVAVAQLLAAGLMLAAAAEAPRQLQQHHVAVVADVRPALLLHQAVHLARAPAPPAGLEGIEHPQPRADRLPRVHQLQHAVGLAVVDGLAVERVVAAAHRGIEREALVRGRQAAPTVPRRVAVGIVVAAAVITVHPAIEVERQDVGHQLHVDGELPAQARRALLVGRGTDKHRLPVHLRQACLLQDGVLVVDVAARQVDAHPRVAPAQLQAVAVRAVRLQVAVAAVHLQVGQLLRDVAQVGQRRQVGTAAEAIAQAGAPEQRVAQLHLGTERVERVAPPGLVEILSRHAGAHAVVQLAQATLHLHVAIQAGVVHVRHLVHRAHVAVAGVAVQVAQPGSEGDALEVLAVIALADQRIALAVGVVVVFREGRAVQAFRLAVVARVVRADVRAHHVQQQLLPPGKVLLEIQVQRGVVALLVDAGHAVEVGPSVLAYPLSEVVVRIVADVLGEDGVEDVVVRLRQVVRGSQRVRGVAEGRVQPLADAPTHAAVGKVESLRLVHGAFVIVAVGHEVLQPEGGPLVVGLHVEVVVAESRADGVGRAQPAVDARSGLLHDEVDHRLHPAGRIAHARAEMRMSCPASRSGQSRHTSRNRENLISIVCCFLGLRGKNKPLPSGHTGLARKKPHSQPLGAGTPARGRKLPRIQAQAYPSEGAGIPHAGRQKMPPSFGALGDNPYF